MTREQTGTNPAGPPKPRFRRSTAWPPGRAVARPCHHRAPYQGAKTSDGPSQGACMVGHPFAPMARCAGLSGGRQPATQSSTQLPNRGHRDPATISPSKSYGLCFPLPLICRHLTKRIYFSDTCVRLRGNWVPLQLSTPNNQEAEDKGPSEPGENRLWFQKSANQSTH